jgi:hypothetical protein
MLVLAQAALVAQTLLTQLLSQKISLKARLPISMVAKLLALW